jgi:hypothetical protein
MFDKHTYKINPLAAFARVAPPAVLEQPSCSERLVGSCAAAAGK